MTVPGIFDIEAARAALPTDIQARIGVAVVDMVYPRVHPRRRLCGRGAA